MGRKRGSTWLSGMLAIDKPEGWTSHDVVAAVRRATGEGRVGHTGTLDPMATGLMIVLVGPATRLADYIESQHKSYRATITFGTATDTDDRTGQVVASAEVRDDLFDSARLANAVANLVGPHEQAPPEYSAIKVDGERSYARARRGEAVELKRRSIEVLSADLVSLSLSDKSITIDITVSKGTYIRSIARDLGIELGTVAHLSALRRTSSGAVSVDSAATVEHVRTVGMDAGSVSPLFLEPLKVLGLPSFVIGDVTSTHGVPVTLPRDLHLADGDLAVGTALDGRALGVYRCSSETKVLRAQATIPGGVQGPSIGKCAVAIGVFDGLHVGHRAVIERCIQDAHRLGVASVAVTFDPDPKPKHPAPSGWSAHHSICSITERVRLIREMGIDHVVILPFTTALAALEPAEFIEGVLAVRLVPVSFSVGADFRFGSTGAGTLQDLERYAPTSGVELVAIDGQVVSSSVIRTALRAGEVQDAAIMLGRPVSIRGMVEEGQQVGSGLGFPTANLGYTPPIGLLRHGVYAASVLVPDRNSSGSEVMQEYPSAVFVGRPRSDDPRRPLLEAHIIGFDGDLYDSEIEVRLETFIRKVVRFETRSELAAAIATDVSRALKLWDSLRR